MASSVLYPSTLYSGLSFYEKLSVVECRQALEEQQRTLKEEYNAVKSGFEAKDLAMQHKIPPMVQLIMENMFSIIKQQQDFVDKALALLEKEQLTLSLVTEGEKIAHILNIEYSLLTIRRISNAIHRSKRLTQTIS
jgi:hypothetical protein